MTFTYTKITEVVYLEESDENEEFGEDFEYEPDYSNVADALESIIYDSYFGGIVDDKDKKQKLKKAISSFLSDMDIQDTLEDMFYDDLKEYFRDEAFESLNY